MSCKLQTTLLGKSRSIRSKCKIILSCLLLRSHCSCNSDGLEHISTFVGGSYGALLTDVKDYRNHTQGRCGARSAMFNVQAQAQRQSKAVRSHCRALQGTVRELSEKYRHILSCLFLGLSFAFVSSHVIVIIRIYGRAPTLSAAVLWVTR